MPPRIVTALIVAFWLCSLGWLGYHKWLPWLRDDSPPPFTVELADEASPPTARWGIWRNNQRLCSLYTRMAVQRDDSFELQSNIENMALEFGLVTFKISSFQTVQKVTRKGELLSIRSNLQMELLLATASVFKLKAGIAGEVRDGKLYAHTRLESSPELSRIVEQELEPFPLETGSIFNPLQPLARLRVYPGQHWRIKDVDPLREAIKAAIRQRKDLPNLGGQLTEPAADVYFATVLDQDEILVHENQSFLCHIIEFHDDRVARSVTGRTWVRVSDGKVLRQEASSLGEKMVLVRED
jgi:hypothetical protein